METHVVKLSASYICQGADGNVESKGDLNYIGGSFRKKESLNKKMEEAIDILGDAGYTLKKGYYRHKKYYTRLVREPERPQDSRITITFKFERI